jgi:hypothetical protein
MALLHAVRNSCVPGFARQTSTLKLNTNSVTVEMGRGTERNFRDCQTKSNRTFEMFKQHEQREEMLLQRQYCKKN